MSLFRDVSGGYEYTGYPRLFNSYKWFKPLLTGLLTVVFMFFFQLVLMVGTGLALNDMDLVFGGGVLDDPIDIYTTPEGLFVSLGGVASMLGALALALRITGERPFSTLSTSRGKWNWGAFFKFLGIGLVIFAIGNVLICLVEAPTRITVNFSVAAVIVMVILLPFQCIAEEYIFRGFVMQTVGAWTRIPWVALLVQAVAFMLGHDYDPTGLLSILGSGIVFGVLAWKTHGLEASSASHIANNLFAFLAVGMGISAGSGATPVADAVGTVLIDVAYAAVVLAICHSYDWLPAGRDAVAEYNDAHPLPPQPAIVPVPAQLYAAYPYPGQGYAPYAPQPVPQPYWGVPAPVQPQPQYWDGFPPQPMYPQPGTWTPPDMLATDGYYGQQPACPPHQRQQQQAQPVPYGQPVSYGDPAGWQQPVVHQGQSVQPVQLTPQEQVAPEVPYGRRQTTQQADDSRFQPPAAG